MKTGDTPFEIKVALLGNVSAGKSTVLNALLKDKYSEVAMKRTTAGVNYFKLYKKPSEPTDESNNVSGDDKDSSDSNAASPVLDSCPKLAKNPRTAESTLKEISEDNRTKLSVHSLTVPEKFFEVEVDHDLVEMRADTRLVLVDVPGLNEAGAAFEQYKAYVRDQWRTFDCVVLVMDGKQGVNTQDQVFLLHFVKDLLETKKRIPVIVLCNKVDDPEDEEQAELVSEARAEIETTFQVSDRKESLGEMLETLRNSWDLVHESDDYSPAFIPVSAMNGYIQLSAARMSLEQFAGFDQDLIEKLGREQIGRLRWSKFSEEEKIKEVYELVNDPESCKEVISESNFTSFLDALAYFIGGERTQLELLKNQVAASMDLLKSEPFHVGTYARRLQTLWEEWMKLHDKQLGSKQDEFGQQFLLGQSSLLFWERYSSWENLAFQNFESSWKESKPQPSPLAHPLMELLSYYEFIDSSGISMTMEKQRILTRMKCLVSRFLDIMLRENMRSESSSDCDLTKLTPYDLSLAFESVLLVAFEHSFCEAFGSQIVQLRAQMPNGREWISNNFVASLCPACGSEMGGLFVSVMTCPNTKCGQQVRFRTVAQDGRVQKSSVSQFEIKNVTNVEKFPSEWLEMSTDANSGVFVPKHHHMYNRLVKVKVPSSLSNPDHFGHIPWVYCRANSVITGAKEEAAGLKKFLSSLESNCEQGRIVPVTPPARVGIQFSFGTSANRFQVRKKLSTRSSRTGKKSVKDTSTSCDLDYANIITDFYQKYDPLKVRSVPRLLEKYKGREKELCFKLGQKYKVANPLGAAPLIAESTPFLSNPASLGAQPMGVLGTSAAASPAGLAGLGSTFAQKEGIWQCDACLLQNDKDNVQCAACETLRPGQGHADDSKKESDSKPAMSSSIDPSGFSFGGAPGTGFGFDTVLKTTTMASTVVSAFDSRSSRNATGFSFGVGQKDGSIFGSGSVSFGTKEKDPTVSESIAAVSISALGKSHKDPAAISKAAAPYPPMPTKAPAVFGNSIKSSAVAPKAKSSAFPPMPTKSPSVFGAPTKSAEAKLSSIFPPMPRKSPSVFGSSIFPPMPRKSPSVFGSTAHPTGS